MSSVFRKGDYNGKDANERNQEDNYGKWDVLGNSSKQQGWKEAWAEYPTVNVSSLKSPQPTHRSSFSHGTESILCSHSSLITGGMWDGCAQIRAWVCASRIYPFHWNSKQAKQSYHVKIRWGQLICVHVCLFKCAYLHVLAAPWESTLSACRSTRPWRLYATRYICIYIHKRPHTHAHLAPAVWTLVT